MGSLTDYQQRKLEAYTRFAGKMENLKSAANCVMDMHYIKGRIETALLALDIELEQVRKEVH